MVSSTTVRCCCLAPEKTTAYWLRKALNLLVPSRGLTDIRRLDGALNAIRRIFQTFAFDRLDLGIGINPEGIFHIGLQCVLQVG